LPKVYRLSVIASPGTSIALLRTRPGARTITGRNAA
jgi:hypothetical protein